MKIFLCFLLVGLAFGRDYCSAGKLCNADWQCKQEFGTGMAPPKGYCCSGRCNAMPLYLPRGSFCNNTDFCVGQCSSGDSCINNTCVGAMVTPGCNCSTSADCKTPTLDGYTISTSCVNGMCTMKLPRDAACTSDSQCASDSCYQGTCLGENLEYGDSCRLSSECAPYQCLNGKCAFQTEGMTCNVLFSTCDYSKFFCNATTSKCQAFVPLGGYCNGAGQCVSSAYCNTTNGFTYPGPCVARVGEGAACDSLLMPCSSGLSCMNYNYGVKKCVKYYSIPDHGYCTSTIQCKNGDATCAREGANTTANFCVPDHSIKAGGNCSYDVSCPEYASCTGISTPLTCTESYLGKQCDSNSTSSDSSQCDTLDCACNNKCEVPSSEISCGQWEVAEGDPTKMNDADRKMTANAACCGLCFGGSEFSYKTTLTGFQIDCKKLTFTMMPACNTTSGGAPLLLNCDDWNGVSIGATANLSALFLLIASLVAYFQEM